MRAWGEIVDRRLDEYLDRRLSCPDLLREAMRYSVFAGGKRLRPLLVLMAADACLGAIDAALPAACAVEFVHTYSLIHDDLPAMDNDDLRRGQPTCHKKFDVATAILAGDSLLTLAFAVLTDLEPPRVAVTCTRLLANAAGAGGMVGGQIDDLNAGNEPRSLEWLQSLHSRKTGALLTCALQMGGVVAGAGAEKLTALDQFGRSIGLAFQIVDDLIDVEGDAHKVGKEVHKDAQAGKLTYPGLLGVEASRRRAKELAQAARSALTPFGPSGGLLAALADFIVERDH
jgi:geranylgeranyl diphosphate synthase type II